MTDTNPNSINHADPQQLRLPHVVIVCGGGSAVLPRPKLFVKCLRAIF
jgi:hypothetical protein